MYIAQRFFTLYHRHKRARAQCSATYMLHNCVAGTTVGVNSNRIAEKEEKRSLCYMLELILEPPR